MTIQLVGTAVTNVTVTENELAYAVHQAMLDRYFSGSYDDAGSDWYTDEYGNVYLANNRDWHVASDDGCAAMVDTANLLRYGRILTLED